MMKPKHKKTLTGEFKNVGERLIDQTLDGIEEGTGKTREAMERLWGELFESQEAYFQKAIDLKEEEIDSWAAAEERAYQTKQETGEALIEAEVLTQEQLLGIQEQSLQDYLAALDVHAAAIEEKIKLEKNKIVNAFSAISKEALASLAEIEKATEKMENKMIDFAGLFQSRKETFLNTGENGSKEIFEKTILDLSRQRQELEKYAKLLEEIRSKKDIPLTLYNAIRNLSIEDAIRYQEALLAMSDGERAAYLEDWQAIQELAEQTANENYLAETMGVLQQVEAELKDWYGSIPPEFLSAGQLSAEQFGLGFVNRLMQMKSKLQEAVDAVLTLTQGEAETLTAGEENTVQNTYNNTYILKNGGETVAEQLQAIESAETVTNAILSLGGNV